MTAPRLCDDAFLVDYGVFGSGQWLGIYRRSTGVAVSVFDGFPFGHWSPAALIRLSFLAVLFHVFFFFCFPFRCLQIGLEAGVSVAPVDAKFLFAALLVARDF